jgi:prepilin-type N-terminal cleavage/methylation domain-containing protein
MNNRAFTIIELMIVIVIIGILVGLTAGIINSAGLQAKSRDAQRISDLKAVQSALEFYFADNLSYPADITDLVGGSYLNSLPVDPTSDSTIENDNSPDVCDSSSAFVYEYNPGGSTYTLFAKLEVASSNDSVSCSDVLPSCNTEACYYVTNP